MNRYFILYFHSPNLFSEAIIINIIVIVWLIFNSSFLFLKYFCSVSFTSSPFHLCFQCVFFCFFVFLIIACIYTNILNYFINPLLYDIWFIWFFHVYNKHQSRYIKRCFFCICTTLYSWYSSCYHHSNLINWWLSNRFFFLSMNHQMKFKNMNM